MKTIKMVCLTIATALAAASLAAQTTIIFTNTLYYTNRWTSAVARVQSTPLTTNDPWVISFSFSGETAPLWAYSTNNNTAVVGYSANAQATMRVTNSEIATVNGLTVSQVVNAGYFTAMTNAINAAYWKMVNHTIGR